MDVALATASSLPDLDADDAPLLAALLEREVAAEPVVWDDPDVDWAAIPVVVVRTTWDYFDRRDAFVGWAEAVDARTTLLNSARVIRWNTHKGYLRDLEERGVATVPTVWLEAGSPVQLSALLEERGWDEAVLKPAISAGARDTVRVRAGDPAGQVHAEMIVADRDLMIQPFLPAVEEDGELSLLFVEGELTHAVRKRPSGGDFRVQEQFGGRYERVEATAEEAELGAAVVAAVDEPTLYARVDLIAGGDGHPLLVELEVVEPSLYLRRAPEAAARLADAIGARVRAARSGSSDGSAGPT